MWFVRKRKYQIQKEKVAEMLRALKSVEDRYAAVVEENEKIQEKLKYQLPKSRQLAPFVTLRRSDRRNIYNNL